MQKYFNYRKVGEDFQFCVAITRIQGNINNPDFTI